jgi:hypothetical protein
MPIAGSCVSVNENRTLLAAGFSRGEPGNPAIPLRENVNLEDVQKPCKCRLATPHHRSFVSCRRLDTGQMNNADELISR